MITILISTMNRSAFVKRLLCYYAAAKYRHWIYIADSSNDFHAGETKKAIEDIKPALKVRYFEYPGHSNAECTKKMIGQATTPYAVFSGDDDFLVPAGLEKCVEFLQKNKNYSGANGKGFLFVLKEPGPYGEFASAGPYIQRGSDYATAAQRLAVYSNSRAYFVALFSVYRKEVWEEMYKNTFSIGDEEFGGELMPCFKALMEGNIKHIDTLYLARQVHEGRYHLSDSYDWILGPQWNSSCKIFSGALAESIVRKDGIEEEAARNLAKQALWRYVSTRLNIEFQQRYGRPRFEIKSHIKGMLKKIRPAHSILRKVKGLISPMSLPALLNPRSPYYKDFIQIYGSVTKNK